MEEEVDEMTLWQQDEPHDYFPLGVIHCPLEGDPLREMYSLPSVAPSTQEVGSFWRRQVVAMEDFYMDPNLSRPLKRGRTRMKPLSPSTMATRLKTLEEFVGFCVRWQAQQGTLELVLLPHLASKFMGFLKAKGLALGTMKKVATHLGQVVEFVCSTSCPRVGRGPTHVEQERLEAWYANLGAKVLATMKLAHSSSPSLGFTLWEAWKEAKAKWESFKDALEANQGEWTLSLARECHDCVLRMLVVGVHQPPMRVGALRLLHNQGALEEPCISEECRDPTTCPTNHMEYFKDRHGHKAEMVLVHFKNEAMKGEQHLPIAKALLEPLAMLERARNACFHGSHSLFYNQSGQPYPGPYFSTICSNLLTFNGERATANTFRHMFTTVWRDFTSCPTTTLMGLTIQEVDAAAAELMLNSTEAWNATYDDSNRARGISTTLALWPKFVDFVHEQHKDIASEQAWDPLTIDLGLLALD